MRKVGKIILASQMKSFANKTVVISGASRGIGLAVAHRLAKAGANIAILAKTTTPHPKLPGTIYTASEELISRYKVRALPVPCDLREESDIDSAIQAVGPLKLIPCRL